MSVVPTPSRIRTLADLVVQLGGVPLDRIRFHPSPGTATVQDVIDVQEREGLRCELIHGTLVEKPMGWSESLFAGLLLTRLNQFVRPRRLGCVTGEQGTMELMPDLVRIPDVAFTSWDRMPGRRRPTQPIPALVPDLAIEVLSESNRPGEMAARRNDYFSAGVCLVWEFDLFARTATVYTSPASMIALMVADTLDGAPVLPGFLLQLAPLFDEFEEHG